MNDVTRQLRKRKSVRVFEERNLEEPLVQEILESAVMAPTAGNQQLYTILRIRDAQILAELARLCDNQPFIARGRLVLLFLADCLKWQDAFRLAGCNPRNPGVGDLLLAVDDALIAAQNAVVAAESLGIGSCYIGDVMEHREEMARLLDLPETVFPAALLVMGYPAAQQREREKPRRSPMEQIVQENRYHRRTEGELRQMLSNRCAEENYEAWMKAFCLRKYNSDFSREMTRSVAAYLRDFAGAENGTGG